MYVSEGHSKSELVLNNVKKNWTNLFLYMFAMFDLLMLLTAADNPYRKSVISCKIILLDLPQEQKNN